MIDLKKIGAKSDIQYSEYLARIYPDITHFETTSKIGVVARTVTIQVTDDCCMACTYCYQHNKKHHIMTFETAKKIIDCILDPNNTYINPKNCPAITIDFIGGEPFMAIDLIQQTADYFTQQLIELNHPWLFKHRFSICSNGLLYFEPKVQHFIQQYNKRLSFSISIDGDKQLHDSCRIDLKGNGTYDRAMAAVKHYTTTYHTDIGSKMTIAPGNVSFIANAVKDLIKNNYKNIHLNCVYEEGWTYKHANILYQQLKELANYILANKLYLDHTISLFNYEWYQPLDPTNNINWCGGVDNSMIAFDYKGDIFPCLRYMESSLPEDREPIIIGNLDHGIYVTEKEKAWHDELTGVDRRCQSTDECYYCPIAAGCAWCSAYNYECFGTVRKRATFICPMHKATALANVYYWNILLIMENDERRFKNYIPDEWALEIINQDELNMLKNLETFPIDLNVSKIAEIIDQFPNNNLEDIITAYREVREEIDSQEKN